MRCPVFLVLSGWLRSRSELVLKKSTAQVRRTPLAADAQSALCDTRDAQSILNNTAGVQPVMSASALPHRWSSVPSRSKDVHNQPACARHRNATGVMGHLRRGVACDARCVWVRGCGSRVRPLRMRGAFFRLVSRGWKAPPTQNRVSCRVPLADACDSTRTGGGLRKRSPYHGPLYLTYYLQGKETRPPQTNQARHHPERDTPQRHEVVFQMEQA